MKSKGGWSPKETIQSEEVSGDPDENLSAIDSLMTLLGKDYTPEENEEE
jgi:hypothetical protein